MPASTTATLVNRVSSVLAGPPLSLGQAIEPFSLDLQPNTNLDDVFCLLAEEENHDAYLGYAQMQIDLLTINIAKRLNADAHATVRELYDMVNSLRSLVTRDGTAGDYNAELRRWTIPRPAATDQFAVAEILVTVDYDVAL